MKRHIYIIVTLIAISLSACEVEGDKNSYPQTLQGQVLYDITQQKINQQIYLVELIAAVDYYAKAPEDKKEGIKEFFLYNYELKSNESQWILTEEIETITLTHNQKSINEKGAIWTVEVISKVDGKSEKLIDNEHFRLESLGDKYWKVEANKIPNIYIGLNMHGYNSYHQETATSTFWIKASVPYEKKRNLYDLTLESGKGTINSTPSITYEVIESLLYTEAINNPYGNYGGYSFFPTTGKLSIDLEKDHVDATLSFKNSSTTTVSITYKGITEDF